MATIESDFESICIDPNDDLVLYKKELVRSRIEKFLYAICSLDNDDLPTPLSRIEEMYKCLVMGVDFITFTPLSRAEKFVMAMLGAYDVELLPTPNSRSEILMKKIATGDNSLDDVDNLQSRYEFLLAYIIKAGGFNGGSGDFYYKLTSLTSGFTTIYDTLDKPVKNAVLKGYTLVNLVKKLTDENVGDGNKTWQIQGSGQATYSYNVDKGVTLSNAVNGSMVLNYVDLTLFKPNTEYTLFIDVNWNGVGIIPHFTKLTTKEIQLNNGLNIIKFTTISDLTVQNACLRLGYAGTIAVGCEYTFNNIMVLEGDWTNVDIPYFEGIASVKMPVLKTTGKNLFDGDTIFKQGYLNYTTGKFNVSSNATDMITDYIPFSSKGEFVVSYDGDNRVDIVCYDNDKNYINGAAGNGSVINITENTAYIIVMVRNIADTKNRVQIERGTVPTPFEPYKSTIVSCNEEVTLRSNGDICDELNLLTGQLTQRIGEDGVVLSQEVVKTVDLSILDQDGKETKLNTFDDITHVTVSSEGLVPMGDIDIARPIQFVNYSLDNSFTTLYNTIERPVKNAILKGQTLKNIADYNIKTNSNVTIEADGTITITAKGTYTEVFLPALEKLPSTKYWVGINVIENTLNGDFVFHATTGVNCIFAYSATITQGFVGVKEQVRTTMADVSSAVYAFRSYLGSNVTEGSIKYKVMVIPYQEGMENWDIPYFEGMTSVKMPVLTTYGKNLFDVSRHGSLTPQPTGDIQLNSAEWGKYDVKYILKPNTQYTLTILGDGTKCWMAISVDGSSQSSNVEKSYTKTFSTNSNGEVTIGIYANSDKYVGYSRKSITIEEGTVSTPYEPHKSNILTCNEEVELRSIGNTKDELNLVTGELTQRIGKIVLDGSEDWQIREFNTTNTECAIFTINIYDKLENWAYKCDKFNYTGIDVILANNIEGIYTGGKSYSFFINISKTKASTVEEFKNWLSNNNVIVQYLLIESVKTVDLSTLDQDGKETKLNTFDDITHVITSSEGLVPTGEITVATKNATDVIDASVMSLRMDDILNSQRTLEGPANAQSDDIDIAMLGTTDIYEQLL